MQILSLQLQVLQVSYKQEHTKWKQDPILQILLLINLLQKKTYVDGYDKDGAGTTIYANVKDSGDYNVDLTYKNASSDNQALSILSMVIM